jgi:O-antigen/teichoic acid export membrane protein
MKKLLISASSLTIVVMAINFLFKIYLSYHIQKDELGIFYTFLDVVSVGVLGFAGFRDSLVKAYDDEDFQKVFYWYVILFLAIFIISFVGESIYFFYSGFEYPYYYMVTLLFFNSLMLFLSYLNMAYKVYRVMLFEPLVMTIFLVAGYFISNKLFYAFLLSYISRIVWIVVFSKMEFRYKKAPFKDVKNFVKNSFYSSLNYLFSGLYISLSSLVILHLYKDMDFLGEYQIVVRSIFFSLVAIFVYPLNSFTFPKISQLISKKEYKEVLRIERKLLKFLIVMFFLLLFSTLFTKYIISFVFPKEYHDSYKMLNLMLPFLPLIAYTTFSLNIIKGFNRFDLALYVRLLGSAIFFAIASGLYLLGFDAKAVIYSFDLTFLIMAVQSYIYRRRLI